MKQKLTVFLLMIYCCLLFSGIHSVSAASSGTCGKNLRWTLDDAGTLTISGTGAMTSWDFASAPWYSNRSEVKKVVIGNSVTSIGDYAFSYCIRLTSITIPDSVTTIGDDAFFNCTSLTSVTIGDSVTSIGNFAFSFCESLTSVTIPDSVTSIGNSAFSDCTSLTSVTIGDSVTTIGECAFYSCTRLTSVTIGDSVTSIGDSAFYRCTSLTDVYYHGTAEEWNAISIGSNNTPLESATKHYIVSVTLLNSDGTEYAKIMQLPGTALDVDKIPAIDGSSIFVYKDIDMTQEYDFDTIINGDTVLYVKGIVASGTCGTNLTWTLDAAGTLIISGTGAMPSWTWSSRAPWYSNSFKVKKVVIGDSVTSIGDYAFFDCTRLTSITIPDSVTTIGSYAFSDCTSLTSVTIGNSVTSIGYRAFFNCTSLTSVTIPDSVTTIGDYAFDFCISLTSVTIGDSVTSIGYRAFYGCTSLTSITIGDSVTSIGEWAFRDCTSLTSVTIGDSVTTIGDSAFEYCTSLTSVTIGDSVTTIGSYAFDKCTSLTSVTIGDSVTSIGDYAFYYCTSLTSVTIGDSVTSIGDYAFSDCTSLTSVTIGDSVTSIGDYAFSSCRSLTSVTIGDSVTIIGDDAFSYCTSLTSVTIGDSVTSIGEWAFSGCRSLTSITIPDSVTTIGYSAFRNCTSLTDVYYYGTGEEWNAISIGSYNTPLQRATIHYAISVTLLNPDGTEYAKWTQLPGTVLDMEKIPATEGSSISVYKDSAMTQEYDIDTIINGNTVLYVKVMAGIKAKLSDDKKQLQVQPFGILEGSKILVAFYQNGKFQQVQPETYKGEALFFPVNQAYTDIKIMAWQNFDTLKSLCVPEELPIQ